MSGAEFCGEAAIKVFFQYLLQEGHLNASFATRQNSTPKLQNSIFLKVFCSRR